MLFRLTGYVARRYIAYKSQKVHQNLSIYRKQRLYELLEESFEADFAKWYQLMKETIKQTLDAEKYADLLKKGEGDRMAHWDEMKLIAFANILTLVHGASMLTVVLRTQLNVIGGLLFQQQDKCPLGMEDIEGGGDASSPSSHDGAFVLTEQVQEEYMMLTRYLCTDGVQRLAELMLQKTRKIVSSMSLKQKLNVPDIEQILVTIRSRELLYAPINLNLIEGDDAEDNEWCPINEAWHYMLPLKLTKKFLAPADQRFWQCGTQLERFVRELVGESYDIIRAADVTTLFKYLEAQGRNNYLDRISDFLNSIPAASGESDQSQASEPEHDPPLPTEPCAPFAKLIPLMNSFINVPFAEDTWASILVHDSSLKAFSANVYESYSDKEFYDPLQSRTSFTDLGLE